LIVNQIKREYAICHEDLIPYHQETIKLDNIFEDFNISHVFRLQNTKADALAALAATLALIGNTSYQLTVAIRQLFYSKYNLEVNKVYATLANFEPRD